MRGHPIALRPKEANPITWLEPIWLAYPTAALALLTAIFALFVRWWLNAFPVAPLNYDYEPKYARTYRPAPASDYYFPLGVMAATASSAVFVTNPYTYDPHTGRRLR